MKRETLFESFGDSARQQFRNLCDKYNLAPSYGIVERALNMGVEKFIKDELEPLNRKLVKQFPNMLNWTWDDEFIHVKLDDGSIRDIDFSSDKIDDSAEELEELYDIEKLRNTDSDIDMIFSSDDYSNRKKLKLAFPELNI